MGVLCTVLLIAGCGRDTLPVGQLVTTTVAPTSTTTIPTSTTAAAGSVDDPATATTPTTVATTTTLADQSSSSPRVAWQGADGFLLGANLPWYNWGCDFGCGLGARDGQGVSSGEVRDVVAAAIRQASQAGMDVVRWWVFPGKPWQITAGSDQLPAGIDEAVYADFDAALSLAEEFDVSLVFTVFSAPSEIPDPWLTTEVGRQQLADVLGELSAGTATIRACSPGNS